MIYTAFIFTRQQFTTAYCLHGIPFQRRLRQGRREAHPRGVLQVLRLQRLPQECRSVLLPIVKYLTLDQKSTG